MSSYADGYINDAFGTCHRAHASVSGVTAHFPPDVCGIGCLVASELSYLDFKDVSGEEKVAAIIGGSKVSTKLPVIKGLLETVDTLILCGGLSFTFVKALGMSTGNSLVEESMVDTALELLQSAEAKGKQIVIPVDAVCATSFPGSDGSIRLEDTRTFEFENGHGGIEDGWMGLDIGPKTLAKFEAALRDGISRIIFNGPPGVFERPPFHTGTNGLIDVLEDLTKNRNVITVVGGGDSVSALKVAKKEHAVSYVSTGGGATLELLAGDTLPGVAAIADME